ncbi:MAG: hypothetical protein K8T26_11425 [Lentisphaerae bacterium]|nr:hypothetical protein [Lentisphaerota bacterium]
MNATTARQNLYLEICTEHVAGAFGDDIRLDREPGQAFMTIDKVAPQVGGKVLRFSEHEKAWDETTQEFTSWSIVHDGKVFVCYPDKEEEGGTCFKVGHPREVAELLRLFVNPACCVTPGEKAQYESRPFGDLADVYVLIPDGETWRVLDPAALPREATEDFRKAVHFNLIQDWDKLHSGDTVEAHKLTPHWPSLVKSLPTALEPLRDGYILAPDGRMRSAADRAVIEPSGSEVFLDLLLVPSADAISSMYLRALFNGDLTVGRDIRKAFAVDSGLDAFVQALTGMTLHVPRSIHDQIRIAAEHQLIGQWLLEVTEQLAHQRGCFPLRADEHWHLAHTLYQMVDRDQIPD